MIKILVKVILLFGLCLNILYAEDFKLSYFYDETNTLNIDNIKNKQFKTIPKQYSLDIKKNIVWYKVDIQNNTDNTKKLFLHNNVAYMSKNIDIYELKNKKVLNHKYYDLFDKDVKQKMVGKSIVYPSIILPNSNKTIYIKNQSLAHQLIDIDIYDEKQSVLNSMNSSFYSNIIVAILVTLSLYNLMLYFFTKRKEFVFYFFYLFNCAMGLFYMYGSIFHNLGIYGKNTYLFNITAILVTFFLALFIKYIFDIDNKNKKVNTALNFLILVSVADIFYALFIDLYVAVQLLEYVFAISFIVIIYVGFYLYKQKHPLINLFIWAYFIYILGFSFTMMGLIGLIEFSTFTLHASGISLVLEGFIFAYMLSYRLKLLEFKVKDQQKYLLLKNKKEQFGEIIGNIAHQWRQPLNRINLNLAVIDESLKDEIPNKDIIYKKIVSTEKNIHYMSDTIEDFIDFYNPNKEKELFNIYDVVKKALKLLSNRLEGIEVNIFMEKNIEVNGISNEYLQVLLIILNNAIDNFHIQKTRNSKIDISLIEDNNSIVLTIKDNGGGIIKSNIEKVFDPYFTTKYKSEGTGLGLYVAKMLIEDSMDGILDVQVDAGITEFSIKLKR